jgi:tetratricopeptide (TPR) repeat protein
MSKDTPNRSTPSSFKPTMSPADRLRLQAVFQRAQKAVEQGDHEYANKLYTECLVEDPGNLIYLQQFLSNLAKKHGGNKKGTRFSALKIKGARMSMSKAIDKGRWQNVFKTGASALKQNPWDSGTLILLAQACGKLGYQECQLYYFRWALDAAPEDVTVNREAALALAALGYFDRAISCWKRVLQAKPGDHDAEKAIARLSVDKTIQEGGYDQVKRDIGDRDGTDQSPSVAKLSTRANVETAPKAEELPSGESEEKRLLDAIESDPAEISNYLDLAQLYSRNNRLPETERVLTRALSASGGDLKVREQLEDAQLRRVRQQVDIAIARARTEGTQQAVDLARRMEIQANQAELEIYAARVEREPTKISLKYELGLRLKRGGKYREAISTFQAAREDSRRKALVQLHLGECFQQIRQAKLAATSYEAAVNLCEESDLETKKLALYRAGVLATEMKDIDRGENYLTELAAMDFSYRDVAERLDKLASMRDSV